MSEVGPKLAANVVHDEILQQLCTVLKQLEHIVQQLVVQKSAPSAALPAQPLVRKAPVTPIYVLYDIETPYDKQKPRHKLITELSASVISDTGSDFPSFYWVRNSKSTDVVAIFFEYLRDLAHDVVLVAHNGKRFDTHVIEGSRCRAKQEWPANVHGFCDTLYITKKHLPLLPSHSLDALAIHLSVKYEAKDRHTARGDVMILDGVITALAKKVAKNSNELLNTYETPKQMCARVAY